MNWTSCPFLKIKNKKARGDLSPGRPQGWYCLLATAYLLLIHHKYRCFHPHASVLGSMGGAEFPQAISSVFLWALWGANLWCRCWPMHLIAVAKQAGPGSSLLWKMSGGWLTPPSSSLDGMMVNLSSFHPNHPRLGRWSCNYLMQGCFAAGASGFWSNLSDPDVSEIWPWSLLLHSEYPER